MNNSSSDRTKELEFVGKESLQTSFQKRIC